MGKIEEFQGEFRFLSNFYWGHGKPVEFAYQAAKTLDPKEQQWILESKSPGEAKRRGQKVTIRPDWEKIKVPTMLSLLREKFESFELRKLLCLQVSRRLLKETNGMITFGEFVTAVNVKVDKIN